MLDNYDYVQKRHTLCIFSCLFVLTVVQFCEELLNPSNGVVTLSGTLENSTAMYTCDVGFIRNGDETLMCLRNATTIPGVWSGPEPTCTSEQLHTLHT